MMEGRKLKKNRIWSDNRREVVCRVLKNYLSYPRFHSYLFLILLVPKIKNIEVVRFFNIFFLYWITCPSLDKGCSKLLVKIKFWFIFFLKYAYHQLL